MSVGSMFGRFHSNIYMDSSTVEKVKLRYKAITKRINMEYWSSESETNNSLYVGSYGRGTEIYTSDIDIIVRLPWTTKERFDNRSGNVQSQLLTEVKEKLIKTYSTSHISSDGQVVVIAFSDGIRYEIVPTFMYESEKFCYPDTNDGGSWKIMDPKKEMESFNLRHRIHNYTMKKLCRMIRCWKETNSITISGELIDSIVYHFYSSADYVDENPFIYFDWITRDFFKYLSDNTHNVWYTPGSYRPLNLKYPYSTASKAYEAYSRSLEAIKYGDEQPYSAMMKWRDIYGNNI